MLLSLLNSSSKLIGVLTREDYIEQISQNADLLRAFDRIDIEEPNEDQTLKILQHHSEVFAQDFEFEIPEDVLESFVQQGIEHRTEAEQQSVNKLLDYLAPPQHHLNYAERLNDGKTLGSGQIEVACKNMIGSRLNANAARWKICRLNRMIGLCSIMYTNHWNKYWQTTKNPNSPKRLLHPPR